MKTAYSFDSTIKIPDFLKNPAFYLGNEWLLSLNKSKFTKKQWKNNGNLLYVLKAVGLLLLICKSRKVEKLAKKWLEPEEEIEIKALIDFLRFALIIESDPAVAPSLMYINTLSPVLEAQIEVSAIDKILEILDAKNKHSFPVGDIEWCIFGLDQLRIAQKGRHPTQDDIDFDFKIMNQSQFKRTISAIFPEYEKALEEFLVTQTAFV
ncbi:MAG: hypothetical protein L3J07_03790 [Candidatus Magasanikbacteria bacterium]|nr:hypothetical protein [Candidatus Magasanikbacteria bacterium]